MTWGVGGGLGPQLESELGMKGVLLLWIGQTVDVWISEERERARES